MSNFEAMAARAKEIYDESYKSSYELEHIGEYLVIDVSTEQAYLGESPEDAYESATKSDAKGPFHLIRIGHAGAYRVSYTSNAHSDWL